MNIHLGEIRVVMRGPMFPVLCGFSDGSIILWAQIAEEGGATAAIRSGNLGRTWRPFQSGLYCTERWADHGVGPNTIELDCGLTITVSIFTKPITDQPGWYRVARWESPDCGKTVRGPLETRLFLPCDLFNPSQTHYFHGNIIEMPDGLLLAAMQGSERPISESLGMPWRSFLSRSTDRGQTWEFYSIVANLNTIHDPSNRATKDGWQLIGPCEPNILHLGDGKMLCVMRLANDGCGSNPPISPATDEYHDLSYTVRGDEVYPRSCSPPLAGDRYFTPGKPSVPMIISHSSDHGRTWGPSTLMRQARGCFPRLAASNGIVALTYGALTFPRWGNCVAFSADGGITWSEDIQFGPFLTSGYNDIVEVETGRFLCALDCTPPQSWVKEPAGYAAHWVGVMDIRVESV
ncbi:MAG: exo-alpha-sialidase [Lentisphaerae bacterium]|nr:exo-alpha-sialidase [Lentisphaerota bacterium]